VAHTHTHTHRSGHASVKYTADEEISPDLGDRSAMRSASIEVDPNKQMFPVRCTAATLNGDVLHNEIHGAKTSLRISESLWL
jgi:hypothetical protein